MLHKQTRGYQAFWAHRISGVLVLGYLYLHLFLLSAVLLPAGSHDFNAVAKVVEQPVFIVLDLALFAIILVHALNGLRLIAADFGLMIRKNRLAIWLTLAVGAILMFIAVLTLTSHLVR